MVSYFFASKQNPTPKEKEKSRRGKGRGHSNPPRDKNQEASTARKKRKKIYKSCCVDLPPVSPTPPSRVHPPIPTACTDCLCRKGVGWCPPWLTTTPTAIEITCGRPDVCDAHRTNTVVTTFFSWYITYSRFLHSAALPQLHRRRVGFSQFKFTCVVGPARGPTLLW